MNQNEENIYSLNYQVQTVISNDLSRIRAQIDEMGTNNLKRFQIIEDDLKLCVRISEFDNKLNVVKISITTAIAEAERTLFVSKSDFRQFQTSVNAS